MLYQINETPVLIFCFVWHVPTYLLCGFPRVSHCVVMYYLLSVRLHILIYLAKPTFHSLYDKLLTLIHFDKRKNDTLCVKYIQNVKVCVVLCSGLDFEL